MAGGFVGCEERRRHVGYDEKIDNQQECHGGSRLKKTSWI